MKATRLLLLIIISLLSLLLNTTIAQDNLEYPPVTLANTELRSIYSEHIEQEFTISIALPPTYTSSSDTYPVLYLLDPQYSFGTLVDILNSGVISSNLPEILVVGIGFATDDTEEVGELRFRNYMNEADGFLEFIQTELIPIMEADYRIDSSERAIAGWSASGYFVLYALFQNPDLFNRYISISAPVEIVTETGISVIQSEREYAEQYNALFARLFVISGTDEETIRLNNFVDDVIARNYLGLQVSQHLVDGATHNMALSIGLTFGLQDVYCFSFEGCAHARPIIQYEIISDESLPVGTILDIGNNSLPLKESPSRAATTIGDCERAEPTVLYVVDVGGQIWVQLSCNEIIGWIQRTRIE